ncbi:MAG: 3-phosphoshikimate 1-carboxyvinyltransferase, partial [Coriobacteriia bacterium]
MERPVTRATTALKGSIRVPGDKSISHRAVLFAAMAQGTSELSGVLDSADVRSTMAAVAALGARVDLVGAPDSPNLAGTVTGWGDRGPTTPSTPIDCGNSGTTARLLAGVLSGWPVRVTLTGDESLSRRPMARVTTPLADMGAVFETTDGHLPLTIAGASDPAPLDYDSPVASAQVKSAVLLAGLRASGRTKVREPALSRDHTERMLPHFGVPVGVDIPSHAAWVDGPAPMHATTIAVGGDPSSAAFMVAAALLVPGSEIVIEHVSLNPTRIGFLRVLERMGADVTITPDAGNAAEPGGSITARYTRGLDATTVSAREIPSLIDEVPVLAVIAASARGTMRFEAVGELRV